MKNINIGKTDIIIFGLAFFLIIAPVVIFAQRGFIRYRDVDTRCSGNNCPFFKTNRNDKAICLNKKSCVLLGKCYNNLNQARVKGSYEVCNTSERGKWFDPDSIKGIYWLDSNKISNHKILCNKLGYKVAKAGEKYVGEYSNTYTYECCGDDRNEYYKRGRDGTSACCNSRYDYVKNGRCYSNSRHRIPKRR